MSELVRGPGLGSLPSRARDWARGGAIVSLLGRSIFVHRSGASAGRGGPSLLLLHGFPSSSFDWQALSTHLGARPWIALDFLGFGLSEKPRATNDLFHQADLVEALMGELGIEHATIVAHDMGTTVANELMARDLEGRLSFECDEALLCNGSMVIERASLRWEQRVLRGPAGFLLAGLSNRWSLRRGLGALFGERHPLSQEEAACQWALLRREQGNRRLHLAIAYVEQRFRHAERWHGAIRDWPGRLELAWGMRDPVATAAVLDAIRELRPAARVQELPELGHYPQIEDPERFAAVIEVALPAS